MPRNEETLCILKDSHGRQVALTEVKANVRLHDLVAEVEVEQFYTNPQNENIETVYTFPLPIGAVLLGLHVEIGGKKLSGHVIERKKAERDYEEAITDGNSAVMLQDSGPGLYTASIGNLMANESAVIRYRYALMLSWQGSRLRFLLPTTIAPRYGDAEAAGIQPHQIPASSLDVEYPFHLTVLVEGALASATIASPTHAISFERLTNGIAAKLSGYAAMDRDFVLTLESETAQSTCIYTRDGEEHVAVASLRIPPDETREENPLALKVLIDCSGSMAGTSIVQARKATLAILDALRPTDSFNVTLFGNECKHLFPQLMPASANFIAEARSRLENLDADMGGTNMEEALVSTFAMPGSESRPCVLLITDGEVHEHEKLVRRASASAHRVFTVGVGAAVVDVFLQSLAQKTGGACELVSPQEGMAEKILSQFHRLRQPKLEKIEINWPAVPDWTTPLPETFFAGDTVHVFAGFKQKINGDVTLRTALAGKELNVKAQALLCEEKDLPRIAAAKRIEKAPEGQALALSLKYQLLTKWTTYLVIAEREIKAGELPELHQVPQMLAAGWGGVGMEQTAAYSVLDDIAFSAPSFSRSESTARPPLSCKVDPGHLKQKPITPAEFIARMESDTATFFGTPTLPKTISALEAWGMPVAHATRLNELCREGHAESAVVVAYIYALSESRIGHLFGRALKRAILKGWKDVAPSAAINTFTLTLTDDIDTHSWGSLINDDVPF